jgi:aspartyl protease family protein
MRATVLSLLVLTTTTIRAAEDIKLMGLFKDRAIIEVNGVQRILAPGQATPDGVRLISANSREAVLEINGSRTSHQLGDHITTQFSAPAAGKTVTIAPDGQGMYLINGSINDFQVKFIVDTGASVIAMNKHQAKRLGLDFKLRGKQTLSSTASGLDKIYLVKLNRVTVGDIELRDIEGAVHDGDYPELILLGNSFLSRVDMQREGQLLKLEQKY